MNTNARDPEPQNKAVANGSADPDPIRPSISMHDNIPVWYDCCSCEAEPYWEEAMRRPEDNTTAEGTKP